MGKRWSFLLLINFSRGIPLFMPKQVCLIRDRKMSLISKSNQVVAKNDPNMPNLINNNSCSQLL
jgi:hypothetical protein